VVASSSSNNLVSDDVRLGEVVETGTTGFWSESDNLHALPELGALVWVHDPRGGRVFGVVTYGETSGLDPSRRAVRRGEQGLHDDAIYLRHPELEYVLRTLFHAAAVGIDDGTRIRHLLPPIPAPLHYSVHPCGRSDLTRFTEDPTYLSSLLAYSGSTPPEQVVAGHLIWVDRQLDDQHRWLAEATRKLARLMKRDYDRLSNILRVVDPG